MNKEPSTSPGHDTLAFPLTQAANKSPQVGFVSLGCAKDSQHKTLKPHMKA